MPWTAGNRGVDTGQRSSSFNSCVFEILLNPHLEEEGDRGLSNPRVSSLSFGGDDPEMRLLQAQVKEFLAREEEAVEERVREFEKRERDSFARLQKLNELYFLLQ